MKLADKSIAVQLIESFCEAYKRRDLSAILDLFTEDCNVWGTGLDEYRVGKKALQEQFNRDWGQSKEGEIQIVSFVPTFSDALWAAVVCKAIVTIDGFKHTFEHLRGTVIVNKENNQWKISHMHCSFPDSNTGVGNSFPTV